MTTVFSYCSNQIFNIPLKFFSSDLSRSILATMRSNCIFGDKELLNLMLMKYTQLAKKNQLWLSLLDFLWNLTEVCPLTTFHCSLFISHYHTLSLQKNLIPCMWFPIIGEHSLSGNTACRWYINPNLPEAHTVLAKYCLPTIVILLLFHTIPYCAIYCFMQLHSPQLITSFPLYTPIASTVVSSLCNTPQWISSLLFPSCHLLNQNRKL